jgi:hypothetical protein
MFVDAAFAARLERAEARLSADVAERRGFCLLYARALRRHEA